MNVKRRFIGLVAAIAFVAAGGVVANTAVAADDTDATSTKNVLMALGFMQDLNELRAQNRTPLGNEEIADKQCKDRGYCIDPDQVPTNYASGNPVPALQVNSDLTHWAQVRANELAELGDINHDNMYNGAPDWAEQAEHNLSKSPNAKCSAWSCAVFGPEALAIGYPDRDPSHNPVSSWASELTATNADDRQGYGHYLTEISPLANIAGMATAQVTGGRFDGATVTVLEIGYNVGEGKTQTVEDAIEEATPKPQPQSVEPVTVTVSEGIAPSLPDTVKVTYTDGAVKELPVTWESHDWTTQQPGDVTLTGTIEGVTTLTATATVTVQAKQVSSVALSTDSLTVGSTNTGDISDALNTVTATVSYDNGTTDTNQAITWNALTEQQSDIVKSREGGSFNLTGSVAGRQVTVAITVTSATAISVTPKNPSITVPAGVRPSDEQLNPVTVWWSNGDTTTENAVWNLDDVDFSQPSKITLTGTVEGLSVAIDITVTDAVPDHLESSDLGTVSTIVQVDPIKELNALTATVVYSDGNKTSASVQWDSYDQSQYAVDKAGKTFQVTGTVTVGKWSRSVTATVSVAQRRVTTVTPTETEITVESGENPSERLASVGVNVTYDNGVTEPVSDVNWQHVDESVYGNRNGGSTTITGSVTINGANYPVAITLNVNPATVTEVQTTFSDITVVVGADPQLPQTVTVKYSNGDVDTLPVQWNVPADGFGALGDYTLNGVIEDRAEQATLTVHVVEATITGVTNPEAITVDSGTSKDGLALPSTVNATLSNGKTAVVPVVWNALTDEQSATLASRKGGTFTIDGTVQGFDKSATITVSVTPATATGVGFGDDMASTTNLTVESGTNADSLALPKTAQVKWSNGDVTKEPVTWAALTDEQKAILSDRRGGTFEVIGSVSGLKTRAVNNLVAVVTVRNADALSIADDDMFTDSKTHTTVNPSEVPELPSTAQVKWSNGDVTKEPVVWNSADTSQEGAKLTVAGNVHVGMLLPDLTEYKADLPVTAVVTVNRLTQPLKDAVAKAEALSSDDYTQESWKAVSDALDYAKSILNAEHASAQEKIKAREQLNQAIEQLKPAGGQTGKPATPEEKPTVPNESDTERNPEEQEIPSQNQHGQTGQSGQTNQSSTATDKQPTVMSSTGAAVMWVAIVVVVLAAAAGIIAVIRHRHRQS